MNLSELIEHGHFTKSFEPRKRIPESTMAALLDLLHSSPSSVNSQPWHFVVAANEAGKSRILKAVQGPFELNAPKVVNASHLVVFASKNDFNEADVDAHIKHTAEVRGVPVESLAPYRDILIGGIVKSMDEAARNAWARNQVFIALGNLLTSAALLGIDACPMEGFDHAQYDVILGLKAKGYSSAVIATLGYRLPTDKYAGAPKVRFPKEQVFVAV